MSRVLEGPFVRGEGLEWLLAAPERDFGPSDSVDAPWRSRLRLWEDGRPLTPHALHSDIVALGQGRFSHWEGWLRFSSFDGGDPNANGRAYSFRLHETVRPTLLAFGSCHMHSAVRALVREGAVEQIWKAPGLSYSPGETLHLLRHYSGRETAPEALIDLSLSGAPDNPLVQVLGEADYAAIEFSALTDIEMDGTRLIRSRVDDILLAPFVALGPAEGALARRWYIYGLLRANEAVRSAAAEEMQSLLQRIPDPHPMAGQVLSAARGRPSSLEQALGDSMRSKRLSARHGRR